MVVKPLELKLKFALLSHCDCLNSKPLWWCREAKLHTKKIVFVQQIMGLTVWDTEEVVFLYHQHKLITRVICLGFSVSVYYIYQSPISAECNGNKQSQRERDKSDSVFMPANVTQTLFPCCFTAMLERLGAYLNVVSCLPCLKSPHHGSVWCMVSHNCRKEGIHC